MVIRLQWITVQNVITTLKDLLTSRVQDTKFSNAINAKICQYLRIFKHILYLHIGYFISGFQVREAAGGS